MDDNGEFFPSWTTRVVVSILRKFEADDTSVPTGEFGSFVRQNPKFVDKLSPRRFERFVSDVYRDHGLDTILTQQTADGGVDVLVTDPSTGRTVLIECKHTSTGRVIGIGSVRQLIGAAVDWDKRSVILVTNSRFSRPAIDAADRYRKRGFELALADATELLKMLKVYDANQPPLHELDEAFFDDVESSNRQILHSIGWLGGGAA